MPFKEPDPQDPNMLVGVVLPADRNSVVEMAYVFAEEFAHLGYDRNRILSLFKNSFYAGPHGAYRDLGEEAIVAIIDECLAAWGGIRFSISDFGLPIDSGEIQNRKSKIRKKEREREPWLRCITGKLAGR